MSTKRAKLARARLDKVKDTEKIDVKQVHTLLNSTDKDPLMQWSKYVKSGYVKLVTDQDIDGKVIHLSGPSNNVWIATPKDLNHKIGTKLGWLFLIIKSVPDKQFVLEVQILDSNDVKRTYKFDSKATITKLRYMHASLDLNMKSGYWNSLELDLNNLVLRSYGTRFVELCRLRIHGSCKLRRVFSASSYIPRDELPLEYRLIAASPFSEEIHNMT